MAVVYLPSRTRPLLWNCTSGSTLIRNPHVLIEVKARRMHLAEISPDIQATGVRQVDEGV